MFFSSEFWPIALLWAAIGAGITYLMAMTGPDKVSDGWRRDERPRNKKRVGMIASGITFIVVLFAVRGVMYYGQPSFQATWFGFFPILLVTLVPAFASGCVAAAGSKRSIIATVAAALVFFGGSITQYGWNAWGPNNAQRFADLPQIEVAGEDETIPPTDPDRMVLVTKTIAAFKGQSALATQPGVASRFTINTELYTLQYVKGHRYWIAPLTPVNNGDTFWTPLFGGRATSPGYVVVDAEDPEKDAWLKTGFEISVFTDQPWSMNLLRYVYQSGYNSGILDEPIFEVDDEWQPFYTIGYIKRPFGGVAGRELKQVIAVNVAKAEPTIAVYDLKDKPVWLDRVVSDDLVKEYATDWGMYGGEFARQNFWSVFFGVNKTGTMMPTDHELSYTRDDHNVWVVPMSSTHENDHSIIGVLVFESAENKAKFYPGIKGFNEASSVVETMANARDNVRHYPVESVQLYSIYGELTWVAIYAAPQSIGKSFGGIGILHAHSQNAADVIYANDKATALRLYRTQLAQRNARGESVSTTATASTEVTGKIKRIALLPSSQIGGEPTYMFVITGNSAEAKRIFLVTRNTYPRVPLLKEGDEVKFSYLDTGSTETAVNALSCTALDEFVVEQAPVVIETPAPVDRK